MIKTYVLDTNVLLHDPSAMFSFHEHAVVLPAVVLEEIDTKKKNMDELGRNARMVSRFLDQLRKKGTLHNGVALDTGGTLRIELNHRSVALVHEKFPEMTNDNRLLAVALNLKQENDQSVILVSKDALVRIKGDVLGLNVEDYMHDRVLPNEEMYKGYRVIYTDPAVIAQFYQTNKMPVETIEAAEIHPNEYVVCKDVQGSSASAVAVYDAVSRQFVPLRYQKDVLWGIRSRNVQQQMALDLLLDDKVKLVTIVGKAGTGKTLLSLAAGLSQVEDHGVFQKLFVARPMVPVGKDLGYLPGEKDDKLRPWMQPLYDNLEFLFNTNRPEELEQILSGMGSIQVEALTYMRGRSLPEQFIIIDEAQNLTRHEVKTILTRTGEKSKIILMGDPTQIDHPYLDERTNGLSFVVDVFKDEAISGHITLEKGERSELAQIAADLL